MEYTWKRLPGMIVAPSVIWENKEIVAKKMYLVPPLTPSKDKVKEDKKEDKKEEKKEKKRRFI